MTGNNSQKHIHFLLVGNSKDHIPRGIHHFRPDSVVFFTSENLAGDTELFRKSLEDNGVRILDTIILSPFSNNALTSMTATILEAHNKYSCGGNSITVSLTGGTNLMVLAMSLVAIVRGLPAYYCVNNENNTILSIDLLQQISKSINVPVFEQIIASGDVK